MDLYGFIVYAVLSLPGSVIMCHSCKTLHLSNNPAFEDSPIQGLVQRFCLLHSRSGVEGKGGGGGRGGEHQFFVNMLKH